MNTVLGQVVIMLSLIGLYCSLRFCWYLYKLPKTISHKLWLVTMTCCFFLVVLASSLVFNLADGQFSSRTDLIDAPGSSLGRGAQVAGLGGFK